MFLLLRKSRPANALLIATFLSIIGALFAISTSSISSNNSRQILNEKEGEMAYYAAESGVADATDFLNTSFQNWGITLENTDLPTQTSKEQLTNDSQYWISSLSYANNNKIAIIDIIGQYKDAYRKIRVRIESSIPKYFDDYGLLTDGTITINGKKELDMSIHANDGLTLNGPTNTENNAVATQSINENADDPDPTTNPIGGYVDPINVPEVPLSELKELTQQGITLDYGDPDFYNKLYNTPAGSMIYVGCSTNCGLPLNLSGDLGARVIYLDVNGLVTNINTNRSNVLSNGMLITPGHFNINGSADVLSSHPGQLDTVFACGGDVVLNGSRKFQSLFWTNGKFIQNGSSMAGRVIAQKGITFNGNFTLSSSGKLFDFGTFDKIASLSSWQQVSMD